MSASPIDYLITKAKGVPIEDLCRGLKLTRSGDERIGPCPVCGGKDRFSINVKKQVWNCRGCDKGGDTIALEQHLHGTDFKEAVKILTGENVTKPNSEIKLVRKLPPYSYCDPATGEVAYTKTRLEYSDGSKKCFFKPEGRDPPLLYGGERLADFIERPTVWIVEGEKKVHRLRELGVVAVSGDSGFRSRWLPSHAELLRDAAVILCPDSDEQGEDYIANAAACISNTVASLCVVRLFKLNGSKGKDICDWQGDAEALANLAASAEAYVPAEELDGRKPKLNGDVHAAGEAPNRDNLLLSAWIKREMPPRDHLMGGVMCSTSRWFIYGDTGIGKTLFNMDFGGAIGAGEDFLNWTGQRPARVMYLDGEMPAETFKERAQLVAGRYGSDIPFFGYNREVLAADDMPPLNTVDGQSWFWREVESVKPDAVFFDSIMALLIGSMSEEDPWRPMKAFIRELTARRIAQIWISHANDSGKSFGTKTREWEMDTVAKLSPAGEDYEDGAARFEFTKARLRTPSTFEQFKPLIIRRDDTGWFCQDAPKDSAARDKRGGGAGVLALVATAILESYDRLADGIEKSPGFDFTPVQKVPVSAIRNELKRRGVLDTDESGAITGKSRDHFRDAKLILKTEN